MDQAANLDRQNKLLLAMNALYLFSVALSNTFVNVYLWKIKQDFVMIGWFNLANYAAMPFAFLTGGMLVKKMDRVHSIRLGVMVMAAFYLTVLLMGTSSPDFIVLLGLLLGAGAGFYWLGFNIMYFEITNPFNRDRFNGANGYLASVAGMIAPFLAGWLLSRTGEWTGYRILFSISLGIFLLAVTVSFLIQRRPLQGKYSLRPVWNDTLAPTDWRNVAFAHVFHGMREGVYSFLIGLLVFIATQSEFKLGLYTFLHSCVSFLAFYAAGRWMSEQRRLKAMLASTMMLVLTVLPVLREVDFVSLLILGVGSALFFPFFVIPLTSTTFDVIGASREKAGLRVEYIVIREAALSLGRVAGILSFIILVQHTRKTFCFAVAVLLLAANVMLVPCWAFMRRVKNRIGQTEQNNHAKTDDRR